MKNMTKFMQTLDQDIYDKLKRLARQRGVTVQEIIRVVIVPDWLTNERKKMARQAQRERAS